MQIPFRPHDRAALRAGFTVPASALAVLLIASGSPQGLAHPPGAACADTRCGTPSALARHDHQAAYADRFTETLPPLPEGVRELRFRDFFVRPLGPRGLELTTTIRELYGQRVRILGYMVQTGHALPGTLLLTPYPIKMDDCHYGLADDLPPQTVHVEVPGPANQTVPFTPGLLLLTGTLRLGPEPLPDGRNFTVHLRLDPPPSATNEPRPDHPERAGGGDHEPSERAR
jgi:hypothetical protein